MTAVARSSGDRRVSLLMTAISCSPFANIAEADLLASNVAEKSFPILCIVSLVRLSNKAMDVCVREASSAFDMLALALICDDAIPAFALMLVVAIRPTMSVLRRSS